MSEAEIAALVAKAVAEYDSQTSWGEELLANAETIITFFAVSVAGLAVVIRAFHRTDKRLQSLEEYRKTHDSADKAAHSTLEEKIDRVDSTVNTLREESASQHQSLAEKVASMARDLNRLIGFHEARTERDG